MLVITGCKPKTAERDANPGGVTSYDGRGVIQQISADRRRATIAHEAIPGYMPAMTMEFPVNDTNELNGLAAADEVTFKLMVRSNDDWIEGLHFVTHSSGDAAANPLHETTAELKTGDLLPDCDLVAEDGRTVHLSDFQGKALAFTFFFTRCPLPDYCPRMNNDFFETRQLLLAMTNGPANWQLLSISFDPGFDSPAVLAGYAEAYRHGDARHWLFAATPKNALAALAPRLDLMITHQDGNIMSHNLRTVVLDPQGRIFRQLDGNDWTPQELAETVAQAARVSEK